MNVSCMPSVTLQFAKSLCEQARPGRQENKRLALPADRPLQCRAPLRLLWLSALIFAPAHAQIVNDGFDPNADNAVQALVVQADGKIVVGGNFTTTRRLAPTRRS